MKPLKSFILLVGITLPGLAMAGAQVYEPLSASVQAALYKSVSDSASPKLTFLDKREAKAWLSTMSRRMARYIPDEAQRYQLLTTVQYEATRAGLDPQMVLGLVQVESGFKKYAVSSASARGYMQIMPFWVKLIGTQGQDLFHLRTNLRYGCTILRYYLDIEKGNLYRALGRYNGSLGQPEYPNMVLGAWKNNWAWNYNPNRKTAEQTTSKTPG